MNDQRLQYISSGETAKQQYNNILRALDHGVDWVQLRFKNATMQDLQHLAEQIRMLKGNYDFTLIVNDHVKLVSDLDLDGVHLGLDDMPIRTARELIGPHKIIGGTANTFDQVKRRVKEKCNYIGLGPLRFTKTKDNLSPILGLDGYKEIIDRCPNVTLPIFAIGAVNMEDIIPLRRLGVFGVAMSKEIESRLQQPNYINTIKKLLYAQYA